MPRRRTVIQPVHPTLPDRLLRPGAPNRQRIRHRGQKRDFRLSGRVPHFGSNQHRRGELADGRRGLLLPAGHPGLIRRSLPPHGDDGLQPERMSGRGRASGGRPVGRIDCGPFRSS